jgi:hypothetical protein
MCGVTIVVVRLERQETLPRRAAPRWCVQSRYGYKEERSRTTVYTQIYLTCKPKLCIDCDPAVFTLYIRIFRTHKGCPV